MATRTTAAPWDVDYAVRRTYHHVAIALGALAFFVALVTAILVVLYTSLYFPYLLILAPIPVFLGYQAWISERDYGRLQEFLSTLKPWSREMRYVHWLGIRTIFDNGLVLQVYNPGNGPNGFVFMAFLSADGVVQTPGSEELESWTKAFSRRRGAMGLLGRRRGSPTKTRESLESIRARLGSARSAAHLVASSTAVGIPSGSPQYLAVDVFLDRKWMTKGRVVISERDAILSSLGALPTEGTASPG